MASDSDCTTAVYGTILLFLVPQVPKQFHGSGTVPGVVVASVTDSGVKAFVPYTLRHTALTNLGEKAGGDVFVLARIAGHSSITVTQRYIHPQADAINRVFATSQTLVGTKLGTNRGTPKLERSKEFSVTRRNPLNTKKKLVPGVGVEPT